MIVAPDFYALDTVSVARNLIGMCMIHETRQGRTSGRIVETEAYLFHNDPACHASRGKTKRNAVMFGPPGHAYIYLIYGTYHCFNVVTAPVGTGEAVLIRALEPLEGLDLMQRRRGTDDIYNLCSGPGKLVTALGIHPKMNGLSLSDGPLTISSIPRPAAGEIVCTPRIGINVAAELPLRFYLKGSPFASRRCIHAPRRTRKRSNS